METLTYFISDIFKEEIGSENFQNIAKQNTKGRNFKEITIAGSKLTEMTFENVVFENCTFWASSIEDTLFINCLFINCKFQFTQFTRCNFSEVSFENCTWGLSKLNDSIELTKMEMKGNISFETALPKESTRSLSLHEILICA